MLVARILYFRLNLGRFGVVRGYSGDASPASSGKKTPVKLKDLRACLSNQFNAVIWETHLDLLWRLSSFI